MATTLILLVLPTGVVLFFIGKKLPVAAKRQFFRVPIWITSTAISLIMAHRFSGVMGPYVTIFMDCVLFPAFYLMKKSFERKHGEVPPLFSPFKLPKFGNATSQPQVAHA